MIPDFAKIIITIVTVCLCSIGLFGNISLLAATISFKELHHKICYIVAVMASLHVICLVSELYVEALQLRFHPIKRTECFHHIFVYTYAMLAQSAMFFFLWIDVLLAILIPLRHRLFATASYVVTICLPPFILTTCTSIYFSANMDDDYIDFCSPIQVIPPNMEWILHSINISNVGAMLLHVIVFAVLKHKNKNHELRTSSASSQSLLADLKLARSIILLAWIFVFSWCLSIASIIIAIRRLPKRQSLVFQSYIVILALPTYCQGFFVTYFRSARYRKVYKRMHQNVASILLCRNDQDSPRNDAVEPTGKPDIVQM